VTTASTAGLRGLPGLAAYCAAKAGVAGFVRALATDLRGTGVTANAVAPGSTRTAILDESARLYGLESAEAFSSQQPLARLIRPEEVAATIVWLAGVACALGAVVADDSDITVRVQQHGARIVVDVSVPVDAGVSETWSVMTDYDNMAGFISNLETSRILGRSGNVVTVMQKGKAARGLLTFAFQNVREITLDPETSIHSRMISGDLESSEFVTHVIDLGDSSQITNHGEFVPKIWVPPIIGPALIEAETRKQFQELRSEIRRRKQHASANTNPRQ
jgi:hypothetical protein